jgi:hypothetical protein
MARQIGKRPSSSGTGGSGRDPVIGLMTSPRAVRRKPVTVPPTATPRTIEERLFAKAKAADGQDHADQRDLGEMSREELRAALSGER